MRTRKRILYIFQSLREGFYFCSFFRNGEVFCVFVYNPVSRVREEASGKGGIGKDKTTERTRFSVRQVRVKPRGEKERA